MPRFKGRLQGLQVDGRFTKQLERQCEALVKAAAREWLRAMIVRVPIWTGMAAGSVKFARGPNGNLSAFLNFDFDIIPHPRARTSPQKNQLRGGAQGHYNFTTSNHVFRFSFRSDVVHYMHNEFFVRSDRGASGQQIEAPWHSFAAGRVAFQAHIQQGITKLPKVKDFIIKAPILVEATGVEI